MKRPSVLVVTRRTVRKHKYIDYVGEYHLALLIRLGILPVMVPVVEGAPGIGMLLTEHPDRLVANNIHLPARWSHNGTALSMFSP